MTKKIDDYRELPNFETKRVPTFIKQILEDQGIVEHFVAIMGNLDVGKDVIEMGAFRKSLAERKNRIRVLDQHQTDSVMRVIGKPLELREVGVEELTEEVLEYAPDATGGLLATTQYAISTDNGRNAYELVKGGFVDESSIGYDPVQVYHKEIVIDGKKVKIRLLKELRLWEYSNVIFGMNPATAVVSAKEVQGEAEQKAVTPYQNLDLAARDRAWDDDAAEGRVRAWAGGTDDMDWQKYRQAFLWYDADEQDQFGSYKLPYADIVGGELVALPRGIFAAAGSLQGARGQEPDIPEADADRIKRNLERYYAKMRTEFEDDSLVAPWKKEGRGAGEQGGKGAEGAEGAAKTETALNITFNMPEGFDPADFGEFEKILAAGLQSVGVTIKEQKGRSLAKLLNDRIDDMVTDDRSRSDIVASMASAAGITAGTVNQILDGDIGCPPERRRRGFAEAMDISLSRINSAMETDGCTVGEESAADDPAEAKEGEVKGMGNSRMGDVLQGNIHYAFTCLADKWYIHGLMNREERLLLSSLIGDALGVLDAGMDEDLAGRDVSYGPLMADYSYGYYGLTPEMDEKAGRMLSARNAQKIQAALAQLHEILMAAGMLPESDEANARHEDEDENEEDEKGGSGAEEQGGGADPAASSGAEERSADETDLLNLVELELQETNRAILF